jgi:hypothetical protein
VTRVRRDWRFGLVLSCVLVTGIYKASMIGTARPAELALSWAIDACAWAWLWIASSALSRDGSAIRNGFVAVTFHLLFYASFLCTFAHAFFFASAVERRFSLVDIDLGTVGFFFARVLPKRGWLVLLAQLLAVHAGAWLVSRRGSDISRRVALRAVLGFTLATSAVAMRSARIPSSLFDIAHDCWELASTARITVGRDTKPRYPPAMLDKSAGAPADFSTPFKQVLVFVMETMTDRKLETERARLDAQTFVNHAISHSHRYLRYFPNNQDSRTGMLDMLSSRVIPYEAYTETGRDHYKFLSNKPSLVDRFNALGFQTVFAESQTDLELVVSQLAWTRTLHVTEAQIRAASSRYLCFVPYEFEHGCEDLALLPQIFSLIDSSDRLLLYQEFIWGHDPAYNRASGKTDTEYYSSYLDAVVAHLEQRGMLDETLIVLTSDHGFRDKGLQDQLAVYHIPLWLYATRFEAQTDQRLFSHIDFKDLLLHELDPSSPAPGANPLVMIVGTTGTGMLTVLTQNDDFMLFKTRAGRHYLLHDAGGAHTLGGDQDPASLLKLFDDYRRSFDAFGMH